MSDTSALPSSPVGSESVQTEPVACASCGTALVGAYCHVCGEKTLVVFFVPVFAAVFALLEIGKKRYALEHVTVGVHFTTLLLLLLPLPFPIVFVGIVLGVIQGGDDLWTLATAFLIGVYGAAFLRHVYGDSRPVSVLKAVVLPFAFYTALAYLYRPILFGIITALL